MLGHSICAPCPLNIKADRHHIVFTKLQQKSLNRILDYECFGSSLYAHNKLFRRKYCKKMKRKKKSNLHANGCKLHKRRRNQLHQGGMHLHANFFSIDTLRLVNSGNKQKVAENNNKKSEKIKKFTMQPYMHTHFRIREQMQILLNFLRQKLFSKILTAFSSNESTPSTATIWYCLSFKLPTNFRSSLRLVPSLFCFRSFCISWDGHPGSNRSKHKVLFFFSSIPTTVRL